MDESKTHVDKHCASVIIGDRASPLMREDHSLPIYHCRGLDYDITAEWQHFRHID